MEPIMNSSSSFDSPVTHENFDDFRKPHFSPKYTSSPRCRNDSLEFIPFGDSTPSSSWRYHSRGRRQSSLSSHLSSDGRSPGSIPALYQMYRHRNSRGRRREENSYHNRSVDISAYYHPSMLEDPWCELEKKLHNSDAFSSSSSKVEPDVEVLTDTSETEQSIELSSQESIP